MTTHENEFDPIEYLENDKICKILQDSYKDYHMDFYKEVLMRFYMLKMNDIKTLKAVINDVCRDFNEIINSFFNSIS